MKVTIEISDDDVSYLRGEVVEGMKGVNKIERLLIAMRDALPRPIQACDRVRPTDDGYSMIGTVEHVARGKAWVQWDADDDLGSADTVWELWGLVRVDDGADQ